MYACVGRLYSSMWDVTKHGGRSPSPTGVNWVNDRVGIDSTEYMHHKVVCFSGSLERATVAGFSGRNRTIPVGLSSCCYQTGLQGFW